MKCTNHPNREARHFCASCGIPLCDDCVEEPKPGQFFCFQCAMVQAVSGVGTSLKDKRVKRDEKAILKKKEPWGPFHYFVVLSSVLIAVMWGVIIFGGPEAVSGQKIDYDKNKRVFLFMVDNSIKRYARYQQNQYPNSLPELVPRYLRLAEEDLIQLNRFSYRLDPQKGYELSYADPEPGEMNIIISPKGIRYESAANVGVSG